MGDIVIRIAILGTRGIPNNYGGFEQNAENLSLHFVNQGHEVTVYSPSEHPYPKKTWNGVRICRVWAFERKLGVIGTALYDFLCLLHAVRSNYDVILELGYGPSGLFFPLRVATSAVLVTNMDGLEWKRSKWGAAARRIWLLAERFAVRWSDALVSDNPGIKRYLEEKFGAQSTYIGYGAEVRNAPNPTQGPGKLNLEPYGYSLLIARLEPENNIEMVLDGYVASSVEQPIVIVGNQKTKYGRYLCHRYELDSRVQFVGAIYNYECLASLRYHADRYFHGHSVGGTNPALLEAMACGALICAHDNEFNRYVLGDSGHFFRSSQQVKDLVEDCRPDDEREAFRQGNWSRLESEFNWENSSSAYLKLFSSITNERTETKHG